MQSHSRYAGKNKKNIINLSSTEFSNRVVKVVTHFNPLDQCDVYANSVDPDESDREPSHQDLPFCVSVYPETPGIIFRNGTV